MDQSTNSHTFRKVKRTIPKRRRTDGERVHLLNFAIGIALSGAVIFALVITGVIGLYLYYQVGQRILPGVKVHDMQLGGMTIDQAAIEIHKRWNMDYQVSVTNGITNLPIQPFEIGVSVDALTTARKAYAFGHVSDPFSDFFRTVRGLMIDQEVDFVVQFNQEQALQGLQALSETMSMSPKNASIYMDGTSPIPTPSKIGYTIDMNDTLERLSGNPQAVIVKDTFLISLTPVAPAYTDTTELKTQIEQLLSAPVELVGYDPISNEEFRWQVSPETVATWILIQETSNAPQLGLDQEKIIAYLENLSAGLGADRWLDSSNYAQQIAETMVNRQKIPIIINHHPTNYIVRPGDTLIKISWHLGIPFWMILRANPGLDGDHLYAGQSLNIPSRDDLLPLPVIPGKRIVISISQQRLLVYLNGEMLSKHVISTGIDRSPTQPGVFQIQTHEPNAYASVWDLYMPNFMGVYEAWPGFMNGIHGLPTLSSGQRLWANVLGRPASYGCIIMKLDEAEWLYNWAEQGVVVEIQP